VHPEERGDRRVGAGHLQGQETVEQAVRDRSRADGVGQFLDAQPGEALDQVERELGPGPVFVGDRHHFRVQEVAHPGPHGAIVVGQYLLELVQVGSGNVRTGGLAHRTPFRWTSPGEATDWSPMPEARARAAQPPVRTRSQPLPLRTVRSVGAPGTRGPFCPTALTGQQQVDLQQQPWCCTPEEAAEHTFSLTLLPVSQTAKVLVRAWPDARAIARQVDLRGGRSGLNCT
jgi:hypothetical protein